MSNWQTRCAVSEVLFNNILVPIDFSAHSLCAFRVAIRMAAQCGAELDLLHIWLPQTAFTQQSPPAIVLAAQEEVAQARLAEVASGNAGVVIRRHLRTGVPVDEIVGFADKLRCDLIVIGTYGHSGTRSLAVGSVAASVLRHASCPVLSCKVSPHFGDGRARRGCAGAPGSGWDLPPHSLW